MADVKELIFTDLPEAFGFGSLSEWGTDKAEDYVGKVKKGKEWIEASKPPVGDVAVLNKEGKAISGDTIPYKGKFEFKLKISEDGAIFYTDDGSDPSNDKSERKRFQESDLLNITKGNRTIRVVACDKDGNYGKSRQISFIDETKKNIIRPTQKTFAGFDTPVTFVFPVDKEGVKASISSLFKEIIDAKIVSVETLEKMVVKLIEEMKS